MKKTQKKGQSVAWKRGLSMMMTLVLLFHAGKPLFAAEVVKTEAVDEKVAELVRATLESWVVAEEPVTEPEPTVQETLLSVCQERGYGEDCAKHLLGMLWKESNNIATAVGDRGKARGYFQIHYKLHKVALECAEDLRCSANWTIDYLERNHYPKYVTYAVQCHNGCNIDNGYAASALRHGRRLWTQPLDVTTAKDRRALALEK